MEQDAEIHELSKPWKHFPSALFADLVLLQKGKDAILQTWF